MSKLVWNDFAQVASLPSLRSRDYAALHPVMRILLGTESLWQACTRNDDRSFGCGTNGAKRRERASWLGISEVTKSLQSAGYSPSIFDYTGKSRLTTYLKASVAPSLIFWQICALLPHHLPMEQFALLTSRPTYLTIERCDCEPVRGSCLGVTVS